MPQRRQGFRTRPVDFEQRPAKNMRASFGHCLAPKRRAYAPARTNMARLVAGNTADVGHETHSVTRSQKLNIQAPDCTPWTIDSAPLSRCQTWRTSGNGPGNPGNARIEVESPGW
jgi:hypothetical protein